VGGARGEASSQECLDPGYYTNQRLGRPGAVLKGTLRKVQGDPQET